MQFAIDENGIRTSINNSIRGKTYKCPCCGTEVIQKKGDIMIWHFAHKSLADCVDYYDHVAIKQGSNTAMLYMKRNMPELVLFAFWQHTESAKLLLEKCIQRSSSKSTLQVFDGYKPTLKNEMEAKKDDK